MKTTFGKAVKIMMSTRPDTVTIQFVAKRNEGGSLTPIEIELDFEDMIEFWKATHDFWEKEAVYKEG